LSLTWDPRQEGCAFCLGSCVHRVTTRTSVRSGEVTLPVKIAGEGQKLIFFNGLGSTQATWKRLIGRLPAHYQIITFDFRGHGGATRAARYTFAGFLSDAETIMHAFGSDRPVVVAWSLGADLIIQYAAQHPGKLAGIVAVDGAVPVPERLVKDRLELHRSLNKPLLKLAMLLGRLTPYGYSLSAHDLESMVLEVDEQRQRLLDVYAEVDCPITLVLAEKSAGEKTLHARRNNRLWRAGAERLVARYPALQVQWLNDTHLLPFNRPSELARIIDGFCARTLRKSIG
jgi:pimeloyl-ACP methyl ester carboxylesterase